MRTYGALRRTVDRVVSVVINFGESDGNVA